MATVTTADEFVQALVAQFPALHPYYEEHLQDNGGLLPHVIFGIGDGFTDRIVAAYLRSEIDALDWRGMLTFLDEQFDRGDREVDAVLVTNFLLRLPWPGQPGYTLIDELPERLRVRFDAVRPRG